MRPSSRNALARSLDFDEADNRLRIADGATVRVVIEDGGLLALGVKVEFFGGPLGGLRYFGAHFGCAFEGIDEAMERLTTRQRTALHLRAAEGLDYATIGNVLGCTPVAARMHVLAARRHVLARLQEHLEP